MLELTADHDLRAGATTNLSLVPEFQVTVNTRQHIRAALGYQVALNNAATQTNQVIFYFLWDWRPVGGLVMSRFTGAICSKRSRGEVPLLDSESADHAVRGSADLPVQP